MLPANKKGNIVKEPENQNRDAEIMAAISRAKQADGAGASRGLYTTRLEWRRVDDVESHAEAGPFKLIAWQGLSGMFPWDVVAGQTIVAWGRYEDSCGKSLEDAEKRAECGLLMALQRAVNAFGMTLAPEAPTHD